MPSISVFCEVMRKACEDWSLGYDQSQRWDIRDGGECDCSSLVIWALKQAGFETGSASYTGDLSDNLTSRGWARLPFSISAARAGDILLNDVHHTCAVISGSGSGAIIAQASIDENGRTSGGRSGDQGSETNTKRIYEYWAGWDCILRYKGEDDGGSADGGKLDVDGVLGPLSVSEWQRQCGTTVDGVVTGQLEEYYHLWPALASTDDYDGTGSDLMRAVQERVGVLPQTGIIAKGTICNLQGWLNLRGYDTGDDANGMIQEGTAKAIQRSLNDGAWE